MRKLLLLLLAVNVLPAVSFAQETPLLERPTFVEIIPHTTLENLMKQSDEPLVFYNGSALKINASVFTQSTAIPAEFSNAFIFPSFISEEKKTAAYDRLQQDNRFGAELQASAMVTFALDSIWKAERKHLRIGYSQQSIFAADFSKDLFHLIFSGNASYAGKEADLNNSRYTSMGYQSFTVGFMQRNDYSMFAVDLGVVRGINYTQIELQQASVFTQAEGNYLDLNWNGSYHQTGRVSNQWKNQPSMGASIHLEARQSFKGKWILHEQIQDLGFIHWNASSTEVKADTAFRFTGLQFFDILNLDKNATLSVGDSLLDKLRGPDITTSHMIALPTLFRLELTRILPKRFTAGISVQYRMIHSYMPLTALNLSKGFGNARSIHLSLKYGGYGEFQTSMRAVVFNMKSHSLSIGTYFNEGFLSPQKLSGTGIQIQYQHHL